MVGVVCVQLSIGLSSDSDIGSNFHSKLSSILNASDTSNRNSLLQDLHSSITSSEIDDVAISPFVVEDCLKNLGKELI